MNTENAEAFREQIRKELEENRKAFEGLYKEELEGLLGLSREELDKIIPGRTDVETYDKLITVVKKASAANISQAVLKDRIVELGGIAVSIAKRVAKLADIFI